MRLLQVSVSAWALVAATSAHIAEGQSSLDHLPLNQIVEQRVLPEVATLFDRLFTEKKDLEIDGTRAFNGRDPFLPGKIAIGLSYVLTNTPRDDAKFARYLAGYREIADLTVDDANETWGVYYYLSALYRLKKAGLLEEAVSPATLASLQEKLDWRRFIAQPEFTLINLPTNYYGVAFSIARLRNLLGWEDETASTRLLAQMLNHYEKYSGEFGFSDETDGEGRFDRYSILLIGEICQRFIETDLTVTPQLQKWLRNAVDVLLVRLNASGDGFDFGRSIGPYGDTAFLEVLSAAAYLGVLSDEEKEMAYTFAARATAKYASFWFDRDMKSVNMWEKGRRTDAYRGKHRILGENLSLSHQLIYTNNLWNGIGFRNRPQSPDFEAWLDRLPRFTVTWFAKGEYDRALITFRVDKHIISLPIVNGGTGQHANTPYYPIPFSPRLVAGVADASFPQLVPKFSLTDGSELMALSYIREIDTQRTGDTMTVSWRQSELDRTGGRAPIQDGRMTVATSYRLAAGQITRTDRYVPLAPLEADSITLEFASFSDSAVADRNTIGFRNGDVYEFDVVGLKDCVVARVDGNETYRSPTGPMITRVACRTGPTTLDTPFTISWTIRYR